MLVNGILDGSSSFLGLGGSGRRAQGKIQYKDHADIGFRIDEPDVISQLITGETVALHPLTEHITGSRALQALTHQGAHRGANSRTGCGRNSHGLILRLMKVSGIDKDFMDLRWLPSLVYVFVRPFRVICQYRDPRPILRILLKNL